MVTPNRLYPFYCTLTLTLTHWQSSVLVTLSFALVSDFNLKILQCTLYRLQLSQHFSLAISFKNQHFFFTFIFLLEVSKELPQRSTLNTSLVAHNCRYSLAQFLTLLLWYLFCVSNPGLQLIFFALNLPHFVNSSIFLPYSGFQFLVFLGPAPTKPLDFVNFFRTRQHVT